MRAHDTQSHSTRGRKAIESVAGGVAMRGISVVCRLPWLCYGRTDVGKRTIAPNEEAELDEVESKLTRRSTFTHTSPLCMTVSGSNTSWVVRSVGFEEKAGPGRVSLWW